MVTRLYRAKDSDLSSPFRGDFRKLLSLVDDLLKVQMAHGKSFCQKVITDDWSY